MYIIRISYICIYVYIYLAFGYSSMDGALLDPSQMIGLASSFNARLPHSPKTTIRGLKT